MKHEMKKNDSPIVFAEDDQLGREQFAKSIADGIDGLDASEGIVVALTGPWGGWEDISVRTHQRSTVS